jgi:hypothetical protein
VVFTATNGYMQLVSENFSRKIQIHETRFIGLDKNRISVDYVLCSQNKYLD